MTRWHLNIKDKLVIVIAAVTAVTASHLWPSPRALATSQEASTISLEQVQAFVLNRHEDIVVAKLKLQEASALVGSGRSAFFPKIGLGASLDSTSTASVGGSDDPITHQNFVYSDWNIFNGFRDTRAIERQKIQVAIAEEELKKVTFDVALAVESEFLTYLHFSELYAISQKAIQDSQRLTKDISARRAMGLSTNSDVRQFQLLSAAAEIKAKDAAFELARAKTMFQKFTGLPSIDSLKPVGSIPHPKLHLSAKELLERLRSHNPTIQQARLVREDRDIATREWQSQWLPKVDVGVQMGRHHRGSGDGAELTSSIVLKFELFSGFQTRFDRQAQSAGLGQANALLDRTIRYELSDLQVILDELRHLDAKVESSSTLVTQSEKYFEDVVKEFSRGFTKPIDLKEARERLEASAIELAKARYDLATAFVRLEKIIGHRVRPDQTNEGSP